MALSNMLREPRREITETLLGMLVAIPLSAYWYLCLALSRADYANAIRAGKAPSELVPVWVETPILMFAFPVFLFLVGLLVLLIAKGIHAAGEWLCDKLDDIGIELRPNRRTARGS